MNKLLISFIIFIPWLSCASTPGNRAANDQDNPAISVTTACILAQISYCNDPQKQLSQYLPGWKIAWYPRPVNGNHAWVATDGSQYAVAIRGTLMEFSADAFNNWIYQDLNIVQQIKWPFSGGADARVSLGSYRGWENLCRMKDTLTGTDLLTFLLENGSAKKPVVFTGHSLGGNLSTVYATYLAAGLKKKQRGFSHINVISFASPSAGNEAFANDFNAMFPQSKRVENSGDIVCKFPCSSRVTALGSLYTPTLDASRIEVGYQNMTVSLITLFNTLGTAISLLEWKNGLPGFTQTNGEGTLINIKPSGNNKTNDIAAWLAEARYQHGIAQYATELGAPVIDCR